MFVTLPTSGLFGVQQQLVNLLDTRDLELANVTYVDITTSAAIEMIRDTVHDVTTTVTQLSALQTQLNVSLSELREGLYNLSMNCTAGTCDLVSPPDSVDLAVDWSSVRSSTVEKYNYPNNPRPSAVNWFRAPRLVPHTNN